MKPDYICEKCRDISNFLGGVPAGYAHHGVREHIYAYKLDDAGVNKKLFRLCAIKMENGKPISNSLTFEEKACLEIGQGVIGAAREIFKECGSGEDFCIQHVGDGSAVFGGNNRLLFSYGNGFRPDEKLCTKRFLAAWEKLGKGNKERV